MDPLALLSGSEGSEAEPDAENCNGVSDEAEANRLQSNVSDEYHDITHNAKRPKVQVDFADLQLAGYQPTDLLQTERYLLDAEGQEGRRPKQPSELEPTGDQDGGETEARACIVERPPPKVEVRTSGTAPSPWSSFDQLPPELRGPLAGYGYETPTPIQAHSLPLLIGGSDLVGVAPTGSGKTLAYLLPGFVRLLALSDLALVTDASRTAGGNSLGPSPLLLVLGPTRELVCQIQEQAERFRRTVGVNSEPVYGGATRAPQLAGLRGRPELVVATPGRLNDFLLEERASCSLHAVVYLVLDEADRMLDDGFEPQVRRIIGETAPPARRQTAMFSATWRPSVTKMASEFLRSPAEIRIGAVDELQANADVAQDVVFCEEHEKLSRLTSLLRGRPRSRAIVFVSTKRTCKDVLRSIRGSVPGRCESLHGDRRQEEREAALAAFRTGEARVLVATDVAGRGLDVPGIGMVVNFDPPRSADDYVHRIGRAGRAGALGLSVSLLTWRDREAERYIEEVMRATGCPVPAELSRRISPAMAPDNPAASITCVMAGLPASSV